MEAIFQKKIVPFIWHAVWFIRSNQNAAYLSHQMSPHEMEFPLIGVPTMKWRLYEKFLSNTSNHIKISNLPLWCSLHLAQEIPASSVGVGPTNNMGVALLSWQQSLIVRKQCSVTSLTGSRGLARAINKQGITEIKGGGKHKHTHDTMLHILWKSTTYYIVNGISHFFINYRLFCTQISKLGFSVCRLTLIFVCKIVRLKRRKL